VISGKVVEWAPDGTRLVVDRDGALQIVDIGTGAITTVAQRHGTHSDPDFKGVEFIGIVHKR
jgi:cyanophycinase-like exopeptidase